jgi:hypothetical protein
MPARELPLIPPVELQQVIGYWDWLLAVTPSGCFLCSPKLPEGFTANNQSQ